jgi:TRAP-type transport system small permease protein
MTRVADGFFNLLKVAMVSCLALMVVLVFGNVVLRYGFNKGITISEEMSRMLFVWLTFISAIVAMREHAHLGVDTLLKRLSPAGKKACFVVSHLMILVVCLMFLQGSWQQTEISLNVKAIAPVTGMSMGWFYGTGVLFSACAALITLAELYKLSTGRVRDDDLVTVRETFEEAEFDQAPEGGAAAAKPGVRTTKPTGR